MVRTEINDEGHSDKRPPALDWYHLREGHVPHAGETPPGIYPLQSINEVLGTPYSIAARNPFFKRPTNDTLWSWRCSWDRVDL